METLRASSYIIPVKLESEEGKYMLIHGYTGAMDIVSEDLLNSIMDINSVSDLSSETLQILKTRGYITTKSQDEEFAYVARIAKALHRKCEVLSTVFTWVVTYNCNFRCPYCFEGRKSKDGNVRIVFTKEMVDNAYYAMDRIQPYKQLRSNVITLYGGEPLLSENKEIITYIVEEGMKRGYSFVAVTNGYEVDCFEDLLGEDKIRKFQITIDGPKEMHNKRRIHFQDDNTFDKIVSNIALALHKGVKIVVRVNIDNSNINDFKDLKTFFEQNGFCSYSNFQMYAALLKDNDSIMEVEHQSLNFLSMKSFINQRKQYDSSSQGLDYGIYKNIYKAIFEKRSVHFKSISCAAQANGYVLDPLGNIYPCWEVIGKKECVEGKYSSDGVSWSKEVLQQWRNTTIGQKKPCNHCKYALLCGGGCPYYHMLGNHMQCVLFPKSLYLAVNKAFKELKTSINQKNSNYGKGV